MLVKECEGDGMKDYFEYKDPGACDFFSREEDNFKIWIFCMKEPDYIMIIIAT